MSDHDGTPTDTGYSTPVPELDDHRRQSVSVPKTRSRRATVETMQGVGGRNNIGTDLGLVNEGLLRTVARDLEEAIIDEEESAINFIPTQRTRTRGGTITTIDGRSDSPPNSVKAFAAARRRERELSNVEQLPAITVSDARYTDGGDLCKTVSGASRAQRGRRLTKENDGSSIKSFASNKSVVDDVCFPLHEGISRNNLAINFEVLEDFIADEELREATREPTIPGRVFQDERTPKETTCFATDGGVIDAPIPSRTSSTSDEKARRTVTGLNTAIEAQRSVENRFEFFASHAESTIHAAEFGDLVLPGEDVRALFTLPKVENPEDEGVWWLNMNSPTDEEIRTICKAFGVHPLTIEDICDREAREKIELFPSYYFAVFRSFNIVEEENGPDFEGFNTYVIVFREGTLSFSFTPNRHAANVRRRVALLKDYVTLSSDWICYAMIDDIVDKFAPVIHGIERDSEKIEDQVFIIRSDDMQAFLRQIGGVRKNVMGLMKLLGGKADVLKGFTKRCNVNYKVTPRMDIGLYLGDIQDHVVTMMSNLGHFEKMLSRSHANYLAGLSIDSLQQGNRANEVLSRITLLAAILVPLNLICGLFGMNVPVPFQESGSLVPWFVIVAFLATIVVSCWVVAKRMKWV